MESLRLDKSNLNLYHHQKLLRSFTLNRLCTDLLVVVVVISLPLPRVGGTARTAIQVYAVNLIETRLGERWQLISNQSVINDW